MKHLAKSLFLAGVLMVLLCVTAMAADATGIYDLKQPGASVKVMKADGTVVTADSGTVNGEQVTGFYADAVKLEVTVSGANSGTQYLVLALNEKATPTEKNIVYIDQNATGTFTVYPKELTSGKTYHIYVTSDAGGAFSANNAVASFTYYAPYRMGDVNNDSAVNVGDVTAILLHVVETQLLTGNNLLAADVNGDGTLNVSDATALLLSIVNETI